MGTANLELTAARASSEEELIERGNFSGGLSNGLRAHLSAPPAQSKRSSPTLRLIATRYDKLAANYITFIKLAAIRIWLPVR
jgi:hypothetical protein